MGYFIRMLWVVLSLCMAMPVIATDKNLVDGIGFLKIGDSEKNVKAILSKMGHMHVRDDDNHISDSARGWIYYDVKLTENFIAPVIILNFHKGKLYKINVKYYLSMYDLNNRTSFFQALTDKANFLKVLAAMSEKYRILAFDDEYEDAGPLCKFPLRLYTRHVVFPSVNNVTSGAALSIIKNKLTGETFDGFYKYDVKSCPPVVSYISVADINIIKEVYFIEKSLMEKLNMTEKTKKEQQEKQKKIKWQKSVQEI